MKHIFSQITVIIILSFVLVACGRSYEPTKKSEPMQSARATPTLAREIIEPVSPISPVPLPTEILAQSDEVISGSEDILHIVLQDLAKVVEEDADIELLSMEEKDWSDTSLGCPQEDMVYAQVITPGYLIILQVGDKEYEYHTDKDSHVILCE